MQINVALPFDNTELSDEFISPEAVTAVARLLERLGYYSVNVTDHPCPTARWRDSGGHDAQDPFVMLSLVAAVTTSLRLQTGILVLPYRNPFITARAASTLDVFSRGRLTLGIGAGYLKGEYYALGVEFARRNELMDEYIQAMKLAWSGEEFNFEGSGYSARGSRVRPRPVQDPHPPLYIGGNSRRAMRRAVELADGWNPFFTTGGISSATTRTQSMADIADVAEGMRYLRQHCDAVGREDLPVVSMSSIFPPGEPLQADAVLDRLGEYRELGVTGAGVQFDGRTLAEWCDQAEQFAGDVLGKLR